MITNGMLSNYNTSTTGMKTEDMNFKEVVEKFKNVIKPDVPDEIRMSETTFKWLRAQIFAERMDGPGNLCHMTGINIYVDNSIPLLHWEYYKNGERCVVNEAGELIRFNGKTVEVKE